MISESQVIISGTERSQGSTLCQKLTPCSQNSTGGAIISFADKDNDAAAKTQVHPQQDWKVSPGSEGPLHHEELSTGSGTAPRLWRGAVSFSVKLPCLSTACPSVCIHHHGQLLTEWETQVQGQHGVPLQGTSASLSWKCAKSWYGRVHAFIPSFTQIHSNIY